MKHILFVLLALLAGAIGGIAGAYALLTHESGRPQQTLRAHRFELVDEAERTTSFWGVDSVGYEVLAFGGRQRSVAQGGSSTPFGQSDRQRLALGLQGKAGRPFVGFYGSDGQLRVLLDVDDFQRPSLMMKDDNLFGLTLGSERSDTPGFRDTNETWALNFLPHEQARIGVSREPDKAGESVSGFLKVQQRKTK